MQLSKRVIATVLMATLGSVLAAAPSSATTGGHFAFQTAHTILSGEDIPTSPVRFHAFGNTVECSEVTFSATSSATTQTSLTISPVYSFCSVPGIGGAEFRMNGCTYVFTVANLPQASDNTIHLVCPEKAFPTITIEGPFGHCRFEITPNQTPTTGGAALESGLGGGGVTDVTVNTTIEGIHTMITEGGFFQCGTSSATSSSGSLTGKVTLTGRNTNGESQGVSATWT